MDDLVKYVWRLTPPDFLPVEEKVSVDGHALTYHEGSIEAVIAIEEDECDCGIVDDLETYIRCYLDAVQLQEHKAYRLCRNERIDEHQRRIYVEPAGSPASGAAFGNVRVIDTDGSVICDAKEEELRSRQKKICEFQRLAELFSAHRSDQCLQAMRKSYGAACADAPDELVHLYEIREAVEALFGTAKKAQEALAISDTDWRSLGRICNREPSAPKPAQGENSCRWQHCYIAR